MSTLRTCPKCQCKSLEGNPISGRVWCGVKGCGYVASLDLDSGVDAGQTHSYEPTDAEEREEWSGTDWCLAWNSEPPGEDVSHECYKAQPNECANEVIDRLIKDVKRLKAERDKFRDLTKRAAVGGLPLAGVDETELIDKLEAENKRLRKSNRALARAALDAERGCPSCAHCQLKRGGHLA